MQQKGQERGIAALCWEGAQLLGNSFLCAWLCVLNVGFGVEVRRFYMIDLGERGRERKCAGFDRHATFLRDLSLWRCGSKMYFPKVSMSFHSVGSILLVTAMVEALSDFRIGRSCERSSPPSMKWALIEESVAHRKTPMLDLVPTHADRLSDRCKGDHPIAVV